MGRTGKFAATIILWGAVCGLGPPPARADELTAVAIYSGQFSTLRGGGQIEIGWEFRFAPRKLELFGESLPWTPAAGAMVTSNGSQYVYVGGRLERKLSHSWVLAPSWALGYYNRQDGKNLGGPLEFRSGLELSRRLGKRGRLGATFYHLSNAGIYRPNPGSESLLLTYSTGL